MPDIPAEPNATNEFTPAQLDVVRAYAAGRLGTRDAIARAGLADYADLIIALAKNDLDLPKPPDSPQRESNVARVSAILQPLLRHGL